MKHLLIALIAGGVSATGFAPLGLWPLTLAAFALLIAMTLNVERMRSAFAIGFAFGLGHFAVGLNWIAMAFTFQSAMPAWLGWIAILITALYLAPFVGAATALAWRIGKGEPLTFILLFAAAWIITEYLRATILFSFGWNPLATITMAQMEGAQLALPAVTRIIGTYGLSAIIVLASGALLLAYRREWRSSLVAAGLPILATLAGFALLKLSAPAAPSYVEANNDRAAPAIRIIQPNIDQSQKWDPDFERRNFARLVERTGETGDRPRLIFWPEAAVPQFIEQEPVARFLIAELLGPDDMLMLGATKLEIETDENGRRRAVGARNALYAMTAEGELIGRYDKAHLVPYGEYLPMRPLLESIGLSRLAPGDLDFWPGPGAQTINVGNFGTAGGQICYEIIFSGEVIDSANRPDFIFNPSN
ncbi:MAG: apolipoprotein N-acyltransferase, partial [Sphingomonadaceae bacterium]|nr:apolipoprotein N-acyltransferase [Sphingomonadaceae bacterium]